MISLVFEYFFKGLIYFTMFFVPLAIAGLPYKDKLHHKPKYNQVDTEEEEVTILPLFID